MSINYFIEDFGEYQLHTEQWCDGGTWITKNGKTLSMRELFKELKKLQCELEAAKRQEGQ